MSIASVQRTYYFVIILRRQFGCRLKKNNYNDK